VLECTIIVIIIGIVVVVVVVVVKMQACTSMFMTEHF
jgi:hypothetical protein